MIWNPIKRYKLKRDWRLVSTLQAKINWIDSKGKNTGKDDTVYYYLKENGFGERKCVHEGTGELAGKAYGRENLRITHPYYLENIRPWLAGRFDPDIPTYESIKAKEFKDALAGKVT